MGDPAQARHALIDQAKETPAPVVVIALDGETLFDASGRSRRIFLEVLAEAGKNDLMRTVMERVEQGAPLLQITFRLPGKKPLLVFWTLSGKTLEGGHHHKAVAL